MLKERAVEGLFWWWKGEAVVMIRSERFAGGVCSYVQVNEDSGRNQR